MTTNLRIRHVAGRPFAIVSGVSGLAAGVCFVAFLASGLASGGPGDGLTSAGLASGVLASVQMVALAPVALALTGRMPAAPAVRIACLAVAAAALPALVLEIVFHRGIWPRAACTFLVAVWILLVSLTGHRRRSLPRPLTRAGLLIGAGLPVGAVLLLPGLVTPEPLRRAFLSAGIGIGALAWLAQPVFTLLLARYVFKEES
jgi:hypothetical protein